MAIVYINVHYHTKEERVYYLLNVPIGSHFLLRKQIQFAFSIPYFTLTVLGEKALLDEELDAEGVEEAFSD